MMRRVARADDLLAALALQEQIVARLGGRDLKAHSPCPGWTVGDVLNHSVGVTQKLSAFASGATDAPRTPPGDLLGDDPALAVHIAAAAAADAWAHADMTRLCRLPFATLTADATAGLNLFDVLAHTWDITTGVGVTLICFDDLWIAALDAAHVVIGRERDRAHYGPEITLSAAAAPKDRFLSFVGRA
jgi:uncharacterized protein (TIGR03086 family)